MGTVRIEVFGGLRVWVDGMPVALHGTVRRTLLALLVAERGTSCRPEWLARQMWERDWSDAGRATMQSHIAHLRRLLEPGRFPGQPWQVIRSDADGYRLAPDVVDLDLERFTAAVSAARRAPDPDAGLAALDEALSLVHGRPFAEFGELPGVLPEAQRFAELVADAEDRRLVLLARSGRHAEVVASARSLAERHPLREATWRHLAASLGALGRPADALRALHQFRQVLREHTGLSPSTELGDLERDLLGAPEKATVGRSRRSVEPTPLRYARNGEVHLAYQVVGQGPTFVAVPPFAQNIEICWQDHHHRRLIERAAERCTFVHFDKRGTGMSDRTASLDLEERLGDFEAVLNDVGVERAVLCGTSEAGPVAIAFAVRHPHRVAGLYLVNTFARVAEAADYPIGVTPEQLAVANGQWELAWGSDAVAIARWFVPSLVDDPAYLRWLGHYMRQSCSPGTLAAINRANATIDVRHLLAQVQVPTVVLHRTGDRVIPFAWGRFLADHIPAAEFHSSPGDDHLPWVGDDWRTVIDLGVDLAHRTAR